MDDISKHIGGGWGGWGVLGRGGYCGPKMSVSLLSSLLDLQNIVYPFQAVRECVLIIAEIIKSINTCTVGNMRVSDDTEELQLIQITSSYPCIPLWYKSHKQKRAKKVLLFKLSCWTFLSSQRFLHFHLVSLHFCPLLVLFSGIPHSRTVAVWFRPQS